MEFKIINLWKGINRAYKISKVFIPVAFHYTYLKYYEEYQLTIIILNFEIGLEW